MSHSRSLAMQRVYPADIAVVPSDPYHRDTAMPWDSHIPVSSHEAFVHSAQGYRKIAHTDFPPSHFVEKQAYYVPQLHRSEPIYGPPAAWSQMPEEGHVVSYGQLAGSHAQESHTGFLSRDYQDVVQQDEHLGDWESAFFSME